MLYKLASFVFGSSLYARATLHAPPLLALLIIGAGHLDAQPTTASALLDGYVAEALRANLSLAQQSTATRRVDAQLRESRGRFLPSVGVNARYSEFSGVINIGDFINPAYATLNQLIGERRFPTNVNSTLPLRQETKLELVQPLFNDALVGATAAVRAQREWMGATRRTTMRQLAADVQSAWLGYASHVRVVETLQSMLPVLDENLRVSDRLVRAGQATPDVVLRARAERSELQQQIADASQQRDAARRGFNVLRNQDVDAPVTIADDNTLPRADTLARGPLESWALSHREELQQADGGLHLAQAQRRIASSASLPNVALAASYGIQGDRYRMDGQHDIALASLVFSWNLFNGGQDVARREQADYAREEAAFRRRDIEQAVRLQVANAFAAAVSARASLTSADDRYESAKRAFALVERRFAEGLATAVEYLGARATYTSAALNQVIARYAVAARAVELERAAALRVLPN